MYRHIGQPYSLQELISGSEIYFKFNEYLDFISNYKTNAKLVKLTCDTHLDREELFNEFSDILSCCLLEAYNMEGILLKIKGLSLRFFESYFLLREILEISNQIRKDSIPTFIPKANEFDLLKIQKLLLELSLESESNFYTCFSINKESNENLLSGLNTLIRENKKALQITGFFEVHINHLRKEVLTPFKRHNSSENNLNDELVKEEVESNFSLLDRFHLFNHLMIMNNYDAITERKKATILSILLGGKETTIREHLRMLDVQGSLVNKKFAKSHAKIKSVISRLI